MTEPASGKIAGEVYATELMGDHALVTCRIDGATITVKAEKAFDRQDGTRSASTSPDGGAPVRQGVGRPDRLTLRSARFRGFDGDPTQPLERGAGGRDVDGEHLGDDARPAVEENRPSRPRRSGLAARLAPLAPA